MDKVKLDSQPHFPTLHLMQNPSCLSLIPEVPKQLRVGVQQLG